MQADGASGLEVWMVKMLIGSTFMQVLSAFGIFYFLKMSKINPWPLTLATLIPFVGMFAAPIFISIKLAALRDIVRRDLESEADKE